MLKSSSTGVWALQALRKLSFPFALMLGLADMQSQGQSTVHIRFEGPPPQAPGTAAFVQQYYESNMWFRPLGIVGPGNGFVRRGSSPREGWPDSGTAYVLASLGDSLMFSFIDGMMFSFLSVDLAEFSTLYQTPLTVRFVGFRQDGSTVTTDLITDGIIDGTGPLADFQTFTFGPEWSGLTRVEIPNSGWSLDNLVVAIPEPGTWALLVLGGVLAGCRFWQRRPKH
jgi:hypothetical protein